MDHTAAHKPTTTPDSTEAPDAPDTPDAPDAPTVTGERADWLEALAHHRHFLRFTARDLTDEQAGLRTTASALCLGGLIKHVTEVEKGWVNFILGGPSTMRDFTSMTENDWAARTDSFRMLPGETLAGILADYADVADRTDQLVTTLPDLGVSWPLPEAPWFQGSKEWSARRVLMHIVTETAHHAGHADIIRESLDGATSMA